MGLLFLSLPYSGTKYRHPRIPPLGVRGIMTKLSTILHHFSKIELNRFEKYLRSPYFNSAEVLIQLFELWSKQLNAKKELSKEEMWASLHPKEKYDDLKFRKYNSQLLKLIEGFLAQEEYEADNLYEANFLMQAVGKRKMEKLINTTLRNAKLKSEQQLYKPADYYFHQYQIEKNAYDLKDFESKRTERTNIAEIINNLDRFYLAEKMRYYCTLLSQQSLVAIDYELLFIDEIVAHIENNKYEDYPAIALYYQIYLTQKEVENKEHYFKFRELLVKYALAIPPSEANEMYRHALNYCIKWINRKDLQFLEEYFNVYDEFISSKIIFEGTGLTTGHFTNIVTISLRLKKYEWTEKFIDQYKSYLPSEQRENYSNFYKAQMFFYQKKYQYVIINLNKVEETDIMNYYISKCLLAATYFELKEFSALESLLDSFRAMIFRNKKLSDIQQNGYKDFIKFVKKLINVTSGDRKEIILLKKDFDNTKNVPSANWLREKIAELEKK